MPAVLGRELESRKTVTDTQVGGSSQRKSADNCRKLLSETEQWGFDRLDCPLECCDSPRRGARPSAIVALKGGGFTRDISSPPPHSGLAIDFPLEATDNSNSNYRNNMDSAHWFYKSSMQFAASISLEVLKHGSLDSLRALQG